MANVGTTALGDPQSGRAKRLKRSLQPAGFIDGAKVMLAQQFNEPRNTALLIRSKMIVDMPAEVILAKLEIVFGATADDVIQSIQAEIFRLAKLKAKALRIEATA